MEKKQKELLGTVTSPAHRAPMHSAHNCCSPALCTASSHSYAPKQTLTTQNRNQDSKDKPPVSLDTQSANVFAEEEAVADKYAAK